ncbi:glycosyl hydrolase family 28 protein [Maribellus sp. YY47]|uniref:glycosyl hydrolase family 28 protein n=1 Tax=Maribellus sp. YY47 TaxID=2929486 RepID=UPI002000A370|nr:glycosyl hydrolase family 28 protein [Maribellus sp. YY47]MCK3686299.1 glycosyl hydrolase family 28 protein [Maribellus sp. YY47]
MPKLFFFSFLLLTALSGCWDQNQKRNSTKDITPNQFEGSDIERIQAAVDLAAKTTGKVVIPYENSNGSQVWLLDSAIVLPGNITVLLENCVLQLSDQCRDNMFRSNNVGIGITDSEWVRNINIIGIGDVYLKGAAHPRSTGDSGRTLTLDPEEERKSGNWRVSFGTDAGKEGVKQKGDWRNIMILMAYVDGFKLKNVTIENAQAWAVSFERTLNADISDIRFNCPEFQKINGKDVFIANRDGIDLRHGCKNFRIDNISGVTGDDFIALSTLGLYAEHPEGGTVNSTMVTSRAWRGPEDNTENIYITNIVCKSSTRAIAIRANDVASINNVYLNGIISEGGFNAMLVGGRGYGKNSLPGNINNIHAMNIIGEGQSLIQIEEAIADCSFSNGIYKGSGEIISYNKIDPSETSNIVLNNVMKMKE